MRLAGTVAATSRPRVLEGDTLWEGGVRLERDVLVPAGARLRIAPDARVSSTGYAGPSHLDLLAFGGRHRPAGVKACRLVVEGRLEAVGTPAHPIRFEGEHAPSIYLVGSASAQLRGAAFSSPEDRSIYLADEARLNAVDCVFSGGGGGIAAGGFSNAALRGCRFLGARLSGLLAHDDAHVELSAGEAVACECGVRAVGNAVVRWGGGRTLRNRAGIQLAGAARLALERAVSRDDVVGLRVGGKTSARAWRARWTSSIRGAILVHERGRLDLRNSLVRSCPNGVLALDAARLRLERAVFRDCRDAAVRRERGCILRSRGWGLRGVGRAEVRG